jgi:hypothetical protein
MYLSYWDLGSLEHACIYCKALFWHRETSRVLPCGAPYYPLCCHRGRVQLPPVKNPPEPLRSFLHPNSGPEGKDFRENIRSYNSVLAFSSMGAKIDYSLEKSRGPYVYKISGQICHRVGSLLPEDGQQPKYAQLYVCDVQDEIESRIAALEGKEKKKRVQPDVVRRLVHMLDENNWVAQCFRMAKDRFKEPDCENLSLRLVGSRRSHGVQYERPSGSEVAGLVVGDFSEAEKREGSHHSAQVWSSTKNRLHTSFLNGFAISSLVSLWRRWVRA